MTILQSFYETNSFSSYGIDSLSFMLIALPCFLFLYYLAPIRLRPVVLLAESLVFYYLAGSVRDLQILAAIILLDYAALRMMGRFDNNGLVRRLCLWFVIVKDLLILVAMGILIRGQNLPLFLGLNVCVASAVDCVLAVYRREEECEYNLLQYGLYILFFPRLYAGPLVSYGRFSAQVQGVRLQPVRVLQGGVQYAQGLAKAGILGSGLYALSGAAARVSQATVLSSWSVVLAMAFSLYYVLSGYSDMARGIGAMFGVSLPQNFYYPYQSRSMTDFFERFNMTISDLIGRRFYAAMGEKRRRPAVDTLCILLCGLLFGLWLGVRINYLLWGVFLAAFVAMEKYLYPKLLALTPTLLARGGTLLVVLLSFTIFSVQTPGQCLELVGSMVRFSAFANDQILYILSSNWMLILVSCVFATNAFSLLATQFNRAAPALGMVLSIVVGGGLLIVYIALAL